MESSQMLINQSLSLKNDNNLRGDCHLWLLGMQIHNPSRVIVPKARRLLQREFLIMNLVLNFNDTPHLEGRIQEFLIATQAEEVCIYEKTQTGNAAFS